MKILRVSKAEPLNGEINVQGSKNAVLPMMAAALLSRETVILHNCPHISDVCDMIAILKRLGAYVRWEGNTLVINAQRINNVVISEEYTRNLRASVLFLGALICREGCVKIAYPGGCDIGKRPLDIHVSALEKLNVKIKEEGCFLIAKGHVNESQIALRYPSVGATENIILASVCVDGIVNITGVAREPEIVALCEMLNAMGADIVGAGGHVITIRGVKRLHGAEFDVPGDRIVAGTYALAAIAVGGHIRINGLKAPDLAGQYMILSQTDAKMSFRRNTWCIDAVGRPKPVSLIKTGPFPGFPTDLQSPVMATLIRARGCSKIVETVYPDRFGIVNELNAMGADIQCGNGTVLVNGVNGIKGGRITATELRGAAGLVIAGLEAEGDTYISGINYLERGYEDICRDLKALGAELEMLD